MRDRFIKVIILEIGLHQFRVTSKFHKSHIFLRAASHLIIPGQFDRISKKEHNGVVYFSVLEIKALNI